MIGDRIVDPRVKAAVGVARRGKFRWTVIELRVGRIAKTGGDFGKSRRIKRERPVLDRLPLGFDLFGKRLGAKFMHQDLDARFVDIVAPAELVVGAQDRFDVTEDVALVQEWFDRLGQEWRPSEAAANHNFEANLAGTVAMQSQREIMDAQRGTIVARCTDRDLELARQERKFRMQRHMLANQLGPDRADPRSRPAPRRPTGPW